MIRYTALLFLILSMGCLGCSGGTSSSEPESPGIQKYVISPTETNPDIANGTDDYYVFAPRPVEAKNKLLVFLPGSLVKPEIYQRILHTGAENGVYSIGLSYQNKFTLTGQCRNEGPDCEGNLSREELEGKDYSDKVEVSRASSFEGRILSLLQYLQKQHPDQNWDQFLNGSDIFWSKIIIVGHSQGSSHAAYIGWHRSVAGVGMFSGPHNVASQAGDVQVNWLNDERKTPSSRFFGFGNTKDNVTRFSLQHAAWSAMNLKGPDISVDDATVPFKDSHQLSTSTGADGLVNGAHGSTCVDTQTPKNGDGNPRFKQVWEYMLFP